MRNTKQKVAGLSLVVASFLYGASTDGTYTNVYGTITDGGTIMSDSEYSNYTTLSRVQNTVVATDGAYSNFAKLEILNGGDIQTPSSTEDTESNTDSGGGTTGGGSTTPTPDPDPEPTPEPEPEEPEIVVPVEPTPEPEPVVPTPEPEEPEIVVPVEPTPDPEPVVPTPEPEPTPEPVDPTPEAEPTVPDTIINNEGNFDEDPTNDDVDVIIIDDNNGAEHNEAINTKETGLNVSSVVEKSDVNSPDTQIFETTLVDDQDEKKKVNISSKVPGTYIDPDKTDPDKTSIVSKVLTIDKEIDTTVQLNKNGTSVSTVVSKDRATEESKAGAVALFRTDVDTNVDEDGSVEVTSNEQEIQEDGTTTDIQAKGKVNSDGSVEHTITRKDSTENEIVTKATSKANNTVASLLDDGSVQTRAKQTKEDGSEITSSVDGKKDGTATHILKVKSSNDIETVSKATSKVKGAQTEIEEDGKINTSVDTKKPGTVAGKRFEAVAETNSNGETVTKYRLVDILTGEEEDPQPTLDNNEKFPAGSEVEIKEDETDSSIIHIQTKTPILNEPKQFKIK
mgnify:CR=1 FL=1